MKFFADLHIHSRYSRGCSPAMDLKTIDEYAYKKGIKLVGTGDFTHREYLDELKKSLVECGEGIYMLRNSPYKTHFMLTAEINCSCIWRDHTRKSHIMVACPTFKEVEDFINIFRMFGNINDGRPTFIIAPKFFIKYVYDISSNFMVIPAHVMTPWFSLFGSKYGFDSIDDALEEEVENITALETGLSADPIMISRLTKKRFPLVSFGDAHSPQNIGRELTAFDCNMNYFAIKDAIRNNEMLFTVEYYPQMGKYFLSGHRDCGTSMQPKDAHGRRKCPTCGGRWTQGVLYRVWQLKKYKPVNYKVKYIVPLRNIIETVSLINDGRDRQNIKLRRSRASYFSIRNNTLYNDALSRAKEIDILLSMPLVDLENIFDEKTAEAIIQVRNGDIEISPGFDGVFGYVNFKAEQIEKEIEELEKMAPATGQKDLFNSGVGKKEEKTF